jgi:hypothetical protein
MTDIIVTTPKREMANSALEAEELKKAGGGRYFRVLHSLPKKIGDGSRIFYVEDGYIRGFCPICEIADSEGSFEICEVTDRIWHGKVFIYMYAKEWKWIKPIRMKGFQAWRYFEAPDDMGIIGDWMDPKPDTKEVANG